MENKKKKVLYLITKSSWGGAGRYVYDLATNIPKEEFETVVALGGTGELKDKLEEQGIRTITISNLQRDINLKGEIKSFFKIIEIIKKEKPDILHTNSSKGGALGALAGRITHTPKIIFTAHGWAFNEERSYLSRATLSFMHWLTILLSHKTIAVSQETKKQVSKMPFVKNKIVVVYNGIQEINFQEKSLAQKEIFPQGIPENITKETVWMGTISELHKNKGLDYMISALREVANTYREKSATNQLSKPTSGTKTPFIFVIIGKGEEEAQLKKQVEKENLQNIVYLAGYKKNASFLLKAFDIFTLTSRTEAFPYVLLEAGLAELPVIASRVGGIPEVISPNRGILVEPGNIDEIKQAIINLLENNNQKEYGENLKEHVIQNLSTQNMAKNTLRYYNKVYKNIN